MARLTDTQKQFLASQYIAESAVFDAGGVPPRFYRPLMEIEEKLFAYNVSPCFRGHTLRTRAGHCIQCDTKRIEFIRRHYRLAYIYIAGSLREKLVKLGLSRSPWDREAVINKLEYGAIKDWQLLFYAKYTNAGQVEFLAHQKLIRQLAGRTYFREGVLVDCREIFRANYVTARKALDLASPDAVQQPWEHKSAAMYNFD